MYKLLYLCISFFQYINFIVFCYLTYIMFLYVSMLLYLAHLIDKASKMYKICIYLNYRVFWYIVVNNKIKTMCVHKVCTSVLFCAEVVRCSVHDCLFLYLYSVLCCSLCCVLYLYSLQVYMFVCVCLCVCILCCSVLRLFCVRILCCACVRILCLYCWGAAYMLLRCIIAYVCICVRMYVRMCVRGSVEVVFNPNPIPPLYGYLCGYRVRIIKYSKTQP